MCRLYLWTKRIMQSMEQNENGYWEGSRMAIQTNERGNSKLAVKSGMWYVAGTFITKGLAFLTTPLFARLMDASDYGEFTNFANWQSLLLIIVSAELYNTLSRAYYDYTEDYDQYASTVTILGGVLTAFFYFLFITNRSWIFEIVTIPSKYVHLMFFVMLLQGAKQVFMVKERTLYHYKSAAVISVLSLVLPTVISVVIVFLVPVSARLDARVYGFYIPYALIGVYCVYSLLKSKLAFRMEYCKYAFTLAIPLLVHYLTTYLLTSTNTIVTKSCLGAEVAALVSITVSIMNVLIMLFQSASGALTTWIMDSLEKDNVAGIKKCINWFAVSAAMVCVGIMFLGPEAVLVIGGSKYKAATALLPGLALGVFFQILTTVFTIFLTYRKRIIGTAVFTGVIAVVSIVAKIVFLPQFGVDVLPLINVVSFGTVFMINYILVIRCGDGNCFEIKFLCPVIAIVMVSALACQHLYTNNIIRYAVCGVCVIIVVLLMFIKRSLWIGLLRKKLRRK